MGLKLSDLLTPVTVALHFELQIIKKINKIRDSCRFYYKASPIHNALKCK